MVILHERIAYACDATLRVGPTWVDGLSHTCAERGMKSKMKTVLLSTPVRGVLIIDPVILLGCCDLFLGSSKSAMIA